MINPNWDMFKSKFNENPQKNFEWFCYLLFCKQFDKKHGIFRYKNQAAIETAPIEIDEEIIAWQAKFYDVSLSKREKELLKMIKTAKNNYPNITKIFLYTNQEWGQYRGKKPQGLKNIEAEAKKLSITLEWKTASFFESPFVSQDNASIAKHFFTLETSLLDSIKKWEKHTDNILLHIKPYITVKDRILEIDRSPLLQELTNNSHGVFIISGVGGVGKTALIKKLYEQVKDDIPFIVFKATEFDLNNLNNLHTGFDLCQFSQAYKNETKKIIIIDSAERLLDIQNTDPFKEFLSTILQDQWTVIFTTRHNYLEDLNYQFFEIYNIVPQNLTIDNLHPSELNTFSSKYSFHLPKDERLLELIRNPFYLNEYLNFYNDAEELDYISFKNKTWNQNIKKSNPEREQSFLKIARERADTGQFFINLGTIPENLNKEFIKDGILGYENYGYFITHDIYEEWALEKIIESEFIQEPDHLIFFDNIGYSLPIRRCFRNWLSEKLLLQNSDIKNFIEDIINNPNIKVFWKDEILVSVLLSNYSEEFFDIFKNELLTNEQALLRRLTFVLRLACKEVDDSLIHSLTLQNIDVPSLTYVWTKPRGYGWSALIAFVFSNIETIGIENINYILPVIYDWNRATKEGDTTKYASLIALKYYQWGINENVYFSRGDTKEHLLQTILYGATEIKKELKDILDNISKNRWKKHRDPYSDLSKMILTGFEGIHICNVLPQQVLQLANLFWQHTPKDNSQSYHSSIGLEQYFGLEEHITDYHPPSAYQTPIYFLLQSSLQKTMDFILSFTNKAIEQYKQSGYDRSIQTIKLSVNNAPETIQYISNGLWNLYRGTSAPITPNVLQSIHMALEKFLLENGKTSKKENLEYWLLYLLNNTKSASITSVVTSIVLAHPEKAFNVAAELFQTKEFILCDTIRAMQERDAKELYSIGRSMGLTTNSFYDNERLETCKDTHRRTSLENLFLNYQCFKSEETSENTAAKRQKILWSILDDYYAQLPPDNEQTDADKTWRMYLARMDKRKMKITAEELDEGVAIQFNPELPPSLKEYNEKSTEQASQNMKYMPLKMWASYKYDNNEKYKEFAQYNNNPSLALDETKKIAHKLESIHTPDSFETPKSDDESFFLFYSSIPAYVCSVMLRDFNDTLTTADQLFCKKIIFLYVSKSLALNYQYQISDGTQPAFSALSELIQIFPKELNSIKNMLLFGLFKEDHVGGMLSSEPFNVFPSMVTKQLWENNFDIAQSLLTGYLCLKPKYDELFQIMREESFANNTYENIGNDFLKKFAETYEQDLKNFNQNKLVLPDIENITKYDLQILNTAFQILPGQINNSEHTKIIKIITGVFAERLLSDDRDNKVDYKVRHDFLKLYAHFVLRSDTDDIEGHLEPFTDKFKASEAVSDLFQEFIFAENALNNYDRFWFIWNCFKEKVISSCKDGCSWGYREEILTSYLFANTPWTAPEKGWHSLKQQNKLFFKDIAEHLKHSPSTLYSIAKLLNGVGISYSRDGVKWIANMLRNQKTLDNKRLKKDTIYYIENFVRRRVLEDREKIKKTKALKDDLLVILNFLTEEGSVVGYMLRERIL